MLPTSLSHISAPDPCSLTSSVPVAEIREPPQVPHPHGEAESRHEEIQLATPFPSLVFSSICSFDCAVFRISLGAVLERLRFFLL